MRMMLGLSAVMMVCACTPAGPGASPAALGLAACRLTGVERIAECGELRVAAHPGARSGGSISLHVVRLRARGHAPQPDPLVLLAGGPGQAASEAFRPLLPVLAAVGLNRDLLLVDQRGTGGSTALDCPATPSLEERFSTTALARAAARCRPLHAADLSAYSTAASAADLEAVRLALGYQRLNLLGVSYGTRLALAYAAAYPARVRAMVLDGVVPPDEPLPLGFARTAQRALERVEARCAADRDCARAFPHLDRSLSTLLEQLDQQPARLAVRHPRSGKRERVTLRRDAAAQAVRELLYAPELVALLPLALDRAAKGEMDELVSLSATLGEEAERDLSLGLTLTILCREDLPRIAPAAVGPQTAGTFLGRSVVDAFRAACERWPTGAANAEAQDARQRSPSARIEAPTLLLSGALDPVTPPRFAARTQHYLKHGRAVVFAGMGHGVTMRGCAPRLIAGMLDAPGELPQLDATCAERDLAPAFFIDEAGPSH